MLADFVLKTKLAPPSPTRSIPNEPVEVDEPLTLPVSTYIEPVDTKKDGAAAAAPVPVYPVAPPKAVDTLNRQ